VSRIWSQHMDRHPSRTGAPEQVAGIGAGSTPCPDAGRTLTSITSRDA